MSKLVVLVLALGACVASPENDDEPAVTNVPRVTANALSPAQLSAGLLSTSVLDASNAAAMGANSQARKVLVYAVGCALDATQTITFTASGTQYTYTGGLGLATGWTTGALSATQAAWVSACLFARVNLTSAVVDISARGTSSGLATTSGELADYQIEEGAFWGNAFLDLGSLVGYACNGVDQAADDGYGDLPIRECAQWDGVTGSNLTPCGFHYAGLCSAACSSTGPYANCAFQGGSSVAAVVSTFLYGTPQ
jgi:hypothetical protein